MGIAYGPTQNWINNTPQGIQYWIQYRIDNNLYVKDGLVLDLDAGDSNSYPGTGTTWTDLSGNNNNGTLVNGVGYSGSDGGSLVFDGVDDYVTTPITTTYQNFTLNCWFYNTSSSKTNRVLITKNSYFATTTVDWPVNLGLNNLGTSVSIRITSGTSFFVTTPSTGSIISTTLSSLNTWYNVSATYDKQNLNLYLNGVLANTTPNTISLPNNTGRVWTIGRAAFENSGGVGDSQYNGNISQVQIYNRALTPEEVQINYNVFKGRYGL